jgi:hypothetical protein
MKRDSFFVITILLFLSIVFISPGSGITQDCDNSNLMTATQQIFYCPMMGSKATPPSAQLGPFPNTKWKITSVVPKPEKTFKSITLSFQPDGNVVETTDYPDGKVETSTNKYSVVGSTLLISKPGNSTSSRFRIDGNTMLVDTGVYSIILEKIN